METITIDELKNIIIENFQTIQNFENWWFKQRKKRISSDYKNKPIMKLMVDYVVILNILVNKINLNNTNVTESFEYPSPKLNLKYFIKNYKSLFHETP